MKLFLPLVGLLILGISFNSHGQSGISFNSSVLEGENLSYPTTLAFGPDNKLYVTQQDGTIFGLTIQKNGPNDYEVINTEVILLVKNIPNHNDRGELMPLINTRQITGILTAGTSTNPILYICSSDPRIGGGGELGDLDLDTNSGTISKLTKNGSTWTMVDLVRALPRSEENHAPNGMALDEVNNILYLAEGGNTNAGSPSNNFAYLTEYALAGAVLKIDLNQINNQFGGSYTIPTLDDPTRANSANGSDVNDPFGGNDGRNQSKIVPGGPVQVYSPGYRNIFDLVLTKTPGKSGRLYTIDNGANGGWGGYPENEGQPNVTNNRIFSEPGSTTPTLNDDKVNNLDNLHYITGPGYYGGHPNPIRANPAGAGLYWFDNSNGTNHFELNPTPDWPPVPVSMAHPVESDFRNPGVNDGALFTWPYSTNGMAEYTSTTFFNGAMAGNLLAASLGGDIHRIELSPDGTSVTNVSNIFTGFGEFPLDVIAQGDGQLFAGSIWVLTYTDANITVFEPISTPGPCSGDNNNFNLDDDADGYSNGDETANGTNPCSPASKPKDFDNDLISDLSDPDDDNDGISDINDKFAVDINNGRNTSIPLNYPFLNGDPGVGLFGVGHTGLMTNYVTNYAANFDLLDPGLIVGGAVGAISVPAQAGDAVTNNQKYAFQFGIPIDQSIGTVTLQSRLLGAPFFNGATGAQLGTQSMGIYFGTGDQDNYLKFVLHANNGNPGFQILCEQNGIIVNQQMIPVAGILSASQMELTIEVNVLTGLVKCRYQTTGSPSAIDVGQGFTVSGNLINLLQAHTDAVAVGIIASSGNKPPFSASWDYYKVATTTRALNILNLNSGGSQQQYGNELWVSDQAYTSGGTTTTVNVPISNTIKDEVYQTERWGNFMYQIPVPASGLYYIDIHLSEIYYGVSTFPAGPGNRVFNVNVENGQFNLTNYDMLQSHAPAQAIVIRSSDLMVNDGFLTINFTGLVDNAKVSGISVFRYTTEPGNAPPTLIKPVPSHTLAATQPSLILPLGQFFADDSGIQNLSFTVSNNTNAALISNTQIVGAQLTFNLSGTTGTGMITLRATDASSAFVETTFQLQVNSTLQTWQPVTYANGTSPLQRHENAFVEVNGKFYLLGGRGIKNVNIFDPVAKTWTAGAPTPIELHHFQAVAYQNKIYVICALTGAYPTETPVSLVYIYDIATNTWSNGPTIPVARRRGSAGTVLYNNKFYIVSGIQNGHTNGWVPWVDVFDPAGAGTWTQLPDAPRARDHFQAALINGKIYCAGGRRTAQPNFAGNTLPEVDVFDISTQTWSTPSQIISPRGAPAVAVVNGELVVAGGEVDYQSNALSTVEVYNPTTNIWRVMPAMNIGRHATQLIYFNGSLYICAGSTTSGAAGENNTMAFASYPSTANTPPVVAQVYPNQSVPANQAGLIVPLNQIFNDDGGIGNLTFTVPGNTNGSLISNTQIVGTQLTFTLSGTTGTGVITLRATDASNTFVETTFQLTVTPVGSAQLVNVIRINSGGPAQTFGAESWVADQYFTGGSVYSTTAAIGNTTQDAIYQSERFGTFQYHIPVSSAGTYAVDLHLAEIYYNSVGARVFSINIENGQFVRTNLDLIQAYGPFLQANVLRADNLNVTDGMIDIVFTAVVESPKVSGIAVGRYTSAPANTPPVVVQTYPNQSIPSTQTSMVVQLGQIFGDDKGVQNLTFTVPNNTNASLISGTQIVGTQLTFTLSGTSGIGVITLRATDASNTFVETTFQLTVTPTGPAQLVNVIRINSGGPAQTFGTESWVADQYFTGGSAYSTTAAIGNTTQDAIYQTERFGNFQYHIPVSSAGTYAVDLHLAEIYFNSVGARVFSINVENGQFVRNNLDLIQTYGPFLQAFVLRADNLNVTDGMIDIVFTSVVDNAKLSGIAVGRYTAAPPANTPPVVVQAYPNQSVPANQAGLIVPLNQIFNDDGGIGNLTFTVPNNTNGSLISGTQIVGTQLTFTLSGTTGTGVITLRATDASNSFVQTTFQLTVAPVGPAQLVNVIRINSGGPAQTFGAESWVADQYFTGGSVYSTTAAIGNTTQDAIYQSERFGNFQYHIPVSSAGTYAVDLHLAEIYYNSVGARVFNINIENGQFVRNNLDLIQAYGPYLQANVLRADNLNVTDGMIDIVFTSVVESPKVSGIAVGRYTSAPANTPPVVVQTYPNQSIPSTQTSLVVQLGQIFGDDNGIGNLAFTVASNTNTSLVSNSAIVGTQLTFTLSGVSGTGAITLRATDASNAFVETTFQLTVTPVGPPQLVNVIRINAGGPAQTFGTESWVADQYFTGGTVYATNAAINNTTQDAIYQSERFGNFQYHIPVPSAGTYAVDLHLAEVYFNSVGARVFSINVENGQFVRNNLDLIQAYGPFLQAIVLRADNLNVTDGMIDIVFTTVVNNAKVSGIAVGRYFAGGNGAKTSLATHAPLVITPPNITLNEGQSWSYQVLASDEDGQRLTFTSKNLPASLYLDKTTGVIKGTIEVNAGTFPVILKVTDDGGISTEVNFTVTISDTPHSQTPEPRIVLYPNPAEKEFSLKVEVTQYANWSFVLVDVTGKPIPLGTFELPEGIQVLDFDLTPFNLSPGFYFLCASNGQGKKNIKVAIK